MSLKTLTNRELFNKWTYALEALALDPENAGKKRAVDRIDNELIRRIEEVAKRPLVQTAKC